MRTIHVLVFATTIAMMTPSRIVHAATVPVMVVANDSTVKDQMLPGVAVNLSAALDGPAVAQGVTDERGQLTVELAAGTYFATLTADDYVQLEATVIQVGTRPQTVTITLTRKLQATDDATRRRLQIVLNWGSDQAAHVRDADAHLICACKKEHIFFGEKEHEAEEHQAQLDVDDMDWGGPETITVLDGPAGGYLYWVYDYSADDGSPLGRSDVTVRVVAGDLVLGQYRIPPEHDSRVWRPFKSVELDPTGVARVVLFSAAETEAGAAGVLPPPETWPPEADATEGESCDGSCDCTAPSVIFLIGLVIFFAVRARKRGA